MLHQAVSVLLLLTALNVSVAGQGKQQKRTAAERSKPRAGDSSGSDKQPIAAEQQRALGVLDKLFDTAKDFDDKLLKIRIQARIADALWDYDEPRARHHFEEAFHAIDEIKPELENASSSPQGAGPQFQLRDEVLRLISRRDPDLARKLIESARNSGEKKDDSIERSREGDNEQALLYLHNAMTLADSDPQKAAQLAKFGLNLSNDPILFFKLAGLLQTLRRKDARVADDLFNYGLSVAPRDPAQLIEKIKWLATYVFPDFGGSATTANLASATNGDGLIRQFLGFVLNALEQRANMALVNPATADDWTAGVRATLDYPVVQQLLPYIDRYLPAGSEAMRVRLGEIWAGMPAGGRDRQTSINPAPGVQDLLSQAESARSPREKDNLYLRAAQQALGENDFEQALSIIEQIRDEGLRVSYDSLVRYQAALVAIGKGEFETAYRYSKQLTSLQQRALVCAKLAGALQSKKDFTRAAEIIDEAERSIGKADDGPDKVRAMLIIADAAARLDPIQGFEIMKSAVAAINHADAGGRSNRNAGFDLSMLNFDQGFPLLARADFERTLSLAQKIENKEASVIVQLAVCRGVLIRPREAQRENDSKWKRQ